jgi:hypothetical protein
VCAAAADATVVSPDDLVEDVISALTRIRDAHAWGAS